MTTEKEINDIEEKIGRTREEDLGVLKQVKFIRFFINYKEENTGEKKDENKSRNRRKNKKS